MSPKPRVAAVQMATGPNVNANLLEAERLIRDAAEAGAGLVVLPENFAFMGRRDHDTLSIVEADGDGPLQRFLAETASRFGVWLVGGTIALRPTTPERLRAAALVYNDQGVRIARYDKIHLFDVDLPGADERYEESATIEAGSDPVVVDSPFGRLGIIVCYDLRFPELVRHMVDSGVEVLAVPAAFTALTGKAHWETLVRARAIENLIYVVAAAQGGYHLSGRETHGHSMIVDPWGAILAQVPRGTGCICSPIDRGFQDSVRRTFPALEHRRLRCK
ncbi:carbon-nitrogen hydrolase family protein [uncultured Thiohalocapsa sp.]|uniref:carbon-nitrogen hydrolase family protein n=1 Tax=uncultured Thiohalocapsa sp. TaxID=768990 RepID=UPI0025FCF3DE|nr:carbon-nitrogen hydrolase family protein [uncultured Thiohalocapsa sp.]